jgi:hypothetical protein
MNFARGCEHMLEPQAGERQKSQLGARLWQLKYLPPQKA